MESYELLVTLAVTLGIGLLIGLEREQSAPAADGQRQRAGGARPRSCPS